MTRIHSIRGNSRIWCLLVFLFIVLSDAFAFTSTLMTRTPGRLAARSPTHASPHKSRHKGIRNKPICGSLHSSSSLHMVLTTPESIIEQASTQKLIDDLIDECVRTSARRPIMLQFDPSSNWIWKRWKGTIFSETWDSVIRRMAYATAVLVLCHSFPHVKNWLSGFGILWGHLLTVTTFTLTFFVNQSYSLWRKCYELSRRLQGRLHDINLTLAAHAVRKPPTNPNEPSTYTAGSRQVLELVSRYIRLFNILTYGSFTRSHRPILTPRGMRRLVERGLMTASEREILVDAEIPATQRHTAVLLWIVRTFVEGREAGHFLGGAGFEEQILEKVHVTRAQYGAIGDELQGRLPLAYAHIVQVLVDIILWMYPWMGYASGMSPLIAIVGTGLLTVSYQGLFDLAKQFLDPYDNESYGKGEDPLVVDTLIAETNAGSVRWLNGLEQYPVSHQRIKEGDLSDMLLPVRGYTVDEAEEIEAERLRKERERFELKAREEVERRRLEEEARYLRAAAEAMIPAQAIEVAVDEGLLSQLEIAVQPKPTVNRGLQLPQMMERVNLGIGATVSEILSYMPSYGSSIAGDILPKGIPLAAEPATFAKVGLRDALATAAQTSVVSNIPTPMAPSVPNLDNINGNTSPGADNIEDLEKMKVIGSDATNEGGAKGLSDVKFIEETSANGEVTNDTEPLPVSDADSESTMEVVTLNDLALVDPLPIQDIAESAFPPYSETSTEKTALALEEEALAEKLEEEAILAAPPAADSIEILEKKEEPATSFANATSVVDELAVLEMDEPSNSTMVTENLALDEDIKPFVLVEGAATSNPLQDIIVPVAAENSNVGELYGPPLTGDDSANGYNP